MPRNVQIEVSEATAARLREAAESRKVSIDDLLQSLLPGGFRPTAPGGSDFLARFAGAGRHSDLAGLTKDEIRERRLAEKDS